MRMAIVGAGLAGLCCAHELERLGYTVDIYEKRDRVGKMFRTVETMMHALTMDPHTDIFHHLRHDLRLPLNPANYVQTAVIHTQNAEATMRGPMGYTTIRGVDERSLELQLARHVQSRIRFDQNPDVEALQQKYDWVFVATGSPKWTQHFGLWSRDITWWVRGANVTGDFDPSQLHFFYNTRYARTGYAMIAPYDERHASVGVGIPDSTEAEMEHGWETFRTEQGHFWSVENEPFKLECYEIGQVTSRVRQNVVLIGNAGGFIEPLGLTGQFSSVCSGVYAARAVILKDGSFAAFCQRWDAYYQSLLRVRRNVNAWTDRDMDRLAGLLSHGIGSLAVRSPVSLLSPAAHLLDMFGAADDPSPGVGPS